MDKNHLVEEEGEDKSLNFIEQIIEEELAEGKNGGRVHTSRKVPAIWMQR